MQKLPRLVVAASAAALLALPAGVALAQGGAERRNRGNTRACGNFHGRAGTQGS